MVSLGSLHTKTICLPNWHALKEPFQVAKTRPIPLHPPTWYVSLERQTITFPKNSTEGGVSRGLISWGLDTYNNRTHVMHIVCCTNAMGAGWVCLKLIVLFFTFLDSIVSSIILARVHAFMTRATSVLSNAK